MLKKAILIIVILILSIIGIGLIMGPDYAATYINKNSKELVGRKIVIGDFDLNLFTGNIKIDEFTMYELGDSVEFVHFDSLYTNLKLFKLLNGQLLSESFHLNGLRAQVIMNHQEFNFSDLIPDSDSIAKSEDDTAQSFITSYTIRDIKINNSSLTYENLDNGASHHVEGISLNLPGISFGEEDTKAGLEFDFTEGGRFKIKVDYHEPTNSYQCNMEVSGLRLNPYLAYIQPFVKAKNIKGGLAGEFQIHGSLNEIATPQISGTVNLDTFQLDDQNGSLFAFNNLTINIDSFDLKNNQFLVEKIQLNQPNVKVINYGQETNFDRFMVPQKKDSGLTKNEEDQKELYYHIDSLVVVNGMVNIEDRSFAKGVFKYELENLQMYTANFDADNYCHYVLSADLNKKGQVTADANLSIAEPAKKSEFNIKIINLPIKDFTLYSERATGYPIEGGRLTLSTTNTINDYMLQSFIDLNMYQTEIGNRIKNSDAESNPPLKLGVTVLEDAAGLIHIDVPAEGNLKDPNFEYTKLIWKTIMNVIIKAAGSPFNLLSKAIGANSEDIKYINYEVLQYQLKASQITQLDLICDLLKEKESLNVQASFLLPETKELNRVKVYVAKRNYYFAKKMGKSRSEEELTAKEQQKIYTLPEDEKMIRFLEKQTDSKKGILGFEQLVNKYVNQEQVEEAFDFLMAQRKKFVLDYVQKKGVIDQFEIVDKRNYDPTKTHPKLVFNYTD